METKDGVFEVEYHLVLGEELLEVEWVSELGEELVEEWGLE